VDFIDVGVGDSRWPTFNVADVAVSLGALLLAYVLWGEDEEGPAPDSVLASSSASTSAPSSSAPDYRTPHP
jgi:signal peptidase II